MLTNIKMKVTPDLSKRIQEIVFRNGGSWVTGETTVIRTDAEYLFINNHKHLFSLADKEVFKETNNFEKISAYNFIVSQGEQKWLPKFDEEAEFSNDETVWIKDNFLSYLPETLCPFIVKNSGITYKYCKPFQKSVSFTQFLKDNNVYKQYFNNIKIENQRWCDKEMYKTLDEIKKIKSINWITGTFYWHLQDDDIDWEIVNSKWRNFIKDKQNIIWE